MKNFLVGRRSFLRGFAAVPLAGRAAADAVAKQLGGFGEAGLSSGMPQASTLGDVVHGDQWIGNQTGAADEAHSRYIPASLKREMMKNLLQNPAERAEIRALVFRCHRRIHSIDPDIGVMRSWSFAAKIAFQRQRLVDLEIEGSVIKETPWSSVKEWVENKLKGFLIG